MEHGDYAFFKRTQEEQVQNYIDQINHKLIGIYAPYYFTMEKAERLGFYTVKLNFFYEENNEKKTTVSNTMPSIEFTDLTSFFRVLITLLNSRS